MAKLNKQSKDYIQVFALGIAKRTEEAVFHFYEYTLGRQLNG